MPADGSDTAMKERRSGLAVTSLVLGIIGCWCVLVRTPLLLLLAIPLGVLTAVLGSIAAVRITRSMYLRGRGMAIAGICLGSASTFFGVVALGIAVVQGISQERVQHQHFPLERISRSVFRNEPLTDFTSPLPIVVLESGVDSVSRNDRVMVRTRFFDTKNGRASISVPPDHEGFGTINSRGHSTKHYPKQSYSFHVTDERGTQINTALLGLPAEEDWILYAPFEDKTMIRDVLAYELARRTGHYAPRTRYIELFLKHRSRGDGKVSMRDYMGVYVLVERIKRDKQRVNIAKLDPDENREPEISGGYIVKRDHSEGSGGRFRTQRGGPYFYIYPKDRNISPQQKTWIRRYFQDTEDAIYGPDFADPRRGYAAYLDVDAFLDLHWLIELSKNVDGFRYSAYLTKDRGQKLKPGPAWDWNRAFGNANYYGGGSTKGWYWSVLRPTEISWHKRLRDDPAYVERAAARWKQLRQEAFNPDKIEALIDQLAAQIAEPQKRNFQRWPILGSHVGSNHYIGDSHRDEVDWLKKWIKRRIDWIDSQVESGNL